MRGAVRRVLLSVVVAGGALWVPQPGVAQPVGATEAVRARESLAPVEVESLRTERERRFVNPDGSWTLEQYVEPVRVRRPDGAWAAVDTTLRLENGVVRPVATAAALTLSAGGTAPLAILGTGYGRLIMSFPAVLPAPALAGDTATYADVLPGVDLLVRATVDGFSHLLAVRHARAAADPRLAEIRFRLGGELTLRPAASGGLEAVTSSGTVAATAGDALMWDSGATAGPVPASPLSTIDSAAGARRAPVATRVDGTDLVLTPDRELLTGEATRFPVFIDPSYAKGYKRWGYANSANENNTTDVARVGLSPDSGAVYRSFFTFDVAPLRGKRILDAKLLTRLVHSWSCASTPVNLYRVGGVASGRMSWGGPALHAWIDERSGHAHKGGNDCGNQPDMNIEFANRLTSQIAEGAAGNWTEFAVGLLARRSNGSGESTREWWKKFAPSATKLTVVYNSFPATPTNLSAEGAGCGSGTGRPVVSSAAPVLRAVVSDPDTDETDLRASFSWERWDGAAWLPLGSGTQTNLRPGATGQVRVTGLTHGGIYRWRVQTIDPYTFNGGSGTLSSAWTGYCEFEVDTVGPGAAPGVSSPVYGTDLNSTYGAVGLTGDFTFTASGVADIAGYKWGWAVPPTATASAPSLGAAVTLALTPPAPKPADPTSGGLVTLYVVSVDRSGRTSPVVEYPFNIGSATAPVGVWEMSEPAGTLLLADTNRRGTQRPATLTNGVAGAPGRILDGPAKAGPKAVTFNGSTSAAATAGPVVDTGKSFSVSAWVRVANSAPTFQTAVGQAGSATSAFFLQFHNGDWRFATHDGDASGASTSVAAGRAWLESRWTHLFGVYDAQGKQLRLYVNGELAGSATRAGGWTATGPLTIGHARFGSTAGSRWSGDIAEVKVWDRVVSEAELAPMAATLVARWALDGDGTDSTAYGRTLGPGTGTVGWTEDREQAEPGAAAFPAGPAWLATSGPVLRTDQSYTVAAWVRSSATGGYQTLLCQFGVTRCAFYLQYSLAMNRWALVLPSVDGGTSTYYAATSAAPPEFDDWVHLTGVYNATNGVLRIYVNGVLEDILTAAGGWHGAGPFRVGFQDAGAVNAAIDDVRVYAGVLAPSEIARICACGE